MAGTHVRRREGDGSFWGQARADVVQRRITAVGFGGGECTTRRVLAQVKERFRRVQRWVLRP